MSFSCPENAVSYLACPRCGLVVMQEGGPNGSPLCRDCKAEDEATVRMDVMMVAESSSQGEPG
jgi:hypothetical protein